MITGYDVDHLEALFPIEHAVFDCTDDWYPIDSTIDDYTAQFYSTLSAGVNE